MSWFKNIKIKSMFFIVFGALLVFSTTLAIFDTIQIVRTNRELGDTISNYQQRQVYIADAASDVYSIRLINFSKWYGNESEEIRDALLLIDIDRQAHITSFHENMDAYIHLVKADMRLSEHERQSWLDKAGEISELFEQYIEITDGLNRAVAERDLDGMIAILLESLPIGSNLNSKMIELRALVFSATDAEVRQSISEKGQSVIWSTAITSVFVILAVIAMLIFTLWSIDKPLENLTRSMEDITAGNLNGLARTDRKDEIGILNNSISDMVEKLKQSNRHEEILQDTLSLEKATSAAKSSFLANMSHEIRTPLNAILGITEIQLNIEQIDGDVREALQKIHRSGDLLLGIINDILDLSKIEAGKLELLPAKYEVASLINDTVIINMMRIGSKPIEFQLNVDENIPSVLIGDTLRIKQILNNLLSNAFKYTSQGVVKLDVSYSDNQSDTQLVCTVSDTGQGMTEDQLEKLFDEYTRFNAEANRTTEGTGLGMSITKNLITLMNGSISIKSHVDEGTVFTVRLPQEKVGDKVLGKDLSASLESFQLDEAKQQRKAHVIYEPMPYGNVLIVDDVESNLYVAQGLLAPYELAVTTVESGFDAIEKIKSGNKYDIIFMDHMMPKMDGLEATEIIRSLGYSLPVVALTANAVAGQADIFLKNGFDDFISKPIDTRQLNAVLKKFVRDKQSPEVLEAVRLSKGLRATFTEEQSREQVTPELAAIFAKDAKKAVRTLENMTVDSTSIKLYTTTVHALKSALANVRELEMSSLAAKLEQAGKAGNMALIEDNTKPFLEKLGEVIKKLEPQDEPVDEIEMSKENTEELNEKLNLIVNACDSYDVKSLDAAISELKKMNLPAKVKKTFADMLEAQLSGDYEKVATLASSIIGDN